MYNPSRKQCYHPQVKMNGSVSFKNLLNGLYSCNAHGSEYLTEDIAQDDLHISNTKI